jgi:hypothetical protein
MTLRQSLRAGETLEAAFWLTGKETRDDLVRITENAQNAFERAAEHHHVVLTTPKARTLRPGGERVPQVPDEISGPDVRLLVYEATILCPMPDFSLAPSILADLEPKDLALLRKVTRDAHRKRYKRATPLTNEECDRIIEEIGPDAAVNALRKTQLH